MASTSSSSTGVNVFRVPLMNWLPELDPTGVDLNLLKTTHPRANKMESYYAARHSINTAYANVLLLYADWQF